MSSVLSTWSGPFSSSVLTEKHFQVLISSHDLAQNEGMQNVNDNSFIGWLDESEH